MGRNTPAPASHLHESLTDDGAGTADLLRRAGCRPTPQRLLVLRALGSGRHVTAEEVLAETRASFPSVNESTVYRTLTALVDADLVRKSDLGGGRMHFELAHEHLHHHAVCERCGTVTHLHDEELGSLAAVVLATTGFQLTRTREMTLPGICPRCQTIERHAHS